MRCLLLALFFLASAGESAQSNPSYKAARYDAGEEKPGGATTHRKKSGRTAFLHPAANLPADKGLDFRVGQGFFKKIWVSSPASTRASDGLGPLFNARSCQQCHLKNGRGHPPKANFPDDTAVSFLLRLSIPPQNDSQQAQLDSGEVAVIPEPVYGTQLQDFSVQGLPAEGRLHIEYREKSVVLSDGQTVRLRQPSYSITNLQYGPLHPAVMLSPRVAPPMVGLGLLELIPEGDILAQADPDDRDGDGISGKAQFVKSQLDSTQTLGRFGWKAGSPTLNQQNQSAFVGDLGLSTPLFPQHAGECTIAQTACLSAPNGADARYHNLEAPTKVTDLVLFYTRNIALPFRQKARDPAVLTGKGLFMAAGCADCHRPRYQTGPSRQSPHLANQDIWPYSDLLLHDMGAGLADHRPEARATGREWRTPPLWGIGKTTAVNGHSFFLHDGRARTLTESILWHGGEAQKARDNFAALSAPNREKLLSFLKSL